METSLSKVLWLKTYYVDALSVPTYDSPAVLWPWLDVYLQEPPLDACRLRTRPTAQPVLHGAADQYGHAAEPDAEGRQHPALAGGGGGHPETFARLQRQLILLPLEENSCSEEEVDEDPKCIILAAMINSVGSSLFCTVRVLYLRT